MLAIPDCRKSSMRIGRRESTQSVNNVPSMATQEDDIKRQVTKMISGISIDSDSKSQSSANTSKFKGRRESAQDK